MSHIFKIVLLLITLMPVTAYAQNNGDAAGAYSPYVINDLKVDVTAENAVKARAKALRNVRNKAFNVLVKRINEPVQKQPSDRVISSLINDFEIVKEQFGTTQYIGTFIVRFNEAAVTNYFSGTKAASTAPTSVYNKNAYTPLSANFLELNTTVLSLEDLVGLKQRLDALSSVQSVLLGRLTTKTARLRVYLNGTGQQFAGEVAQYNMSLIQQGGNLYALTRQ